MVAGVRLVVAPFSQGRQVAIFKVRKRTAPKKICFADTAASPLSPIRSGDDARGPLRSLGGGAVTENLPARLQRGQIRQRLLSLAVVPVMHPGPGVLELSG